MTLKELKQMKKNVPDALLAASFNDLYFWTLWGIAKRIANEGVNKEKIKKALISYADWLGKEAAPQIKMSIPNLGTDAEAAAKMIAFAWTIHDMKATYKKNTVKVTKCFHNKFWKKNKLQDVLSCKDYCTPLMNNFVAGAIGSNINMVLKTCIADGDAACEIQFK